MSVRRLIIGGADVLSMVDHARDCYPNEAVGLLGGASSGHVTAVYRLKNIGPPGTFLAEPFEQWLAFEDLQRKGKQLLAVYHSHPRGGTAPSPSDIHFAQELAALYVILAVKAEALAPVSICAYDARKGR